MSEILRFEDGVTKRLTRSFIGEVDGMYQNAAQNVDEFYRLTLENPSFAIKRISEFIERARKSSGPEWSLAEAYGGGPNHDWTGPILDTVGIVYPVLPPDARKEALSNIFKFLDNQNYYVAQSNVEMINEPWLVADIVANVSLYWCGYKDYTNMLQDNPTWSELYPHLSKVKSAFWMAFAVSQPQYASNEIRDNFSHIFPTLTDRTLDAIAAITSVGAQNEFLRKGIPINQTIEASMFKYDPRFHKSISAKIQERKWVDLDEPLYIRYGPGPEEREWRYRSKIGEYSADQLVSKQDR